MLLYFLCCPGSLPLVIPEDLAASFPLALKCCKQLLPPLMSGGSFFIGVGSHWCVFNLYYENMEWSLPEWGEEGSGPHGWRIQLSDIVVWCLSECLDQEESTISLGPTRRESMRLPKESVQLYFEQCWCVGPFLWHRLPRGQAQAEASRVPSNCYWL